MKRTVKRPSCRPTSLLLALLAPVAGCGTVGAISGVAVEAGRRMLLEKAEANYGEGYTSDLGKMLDIMMIQNLTGAPPVAQQEPVTAEPAPDPIAEPASASLAPLELEISVVREVLLDGRPTPIPIDDGALLRDGVGREGQGDNLKIQFRTNDTCYVYAVWIDATAWATPIFPVSSAYAHANPVESGKRHSLPEGTDWFFLDGHRGVENLYFVASREPMPDLDQLLNDLVGRERALSPGNVASVDEPADLSRGIGGVRPGANALVQSSDGSSHQVASQAFVAQLADGDLVVTRWFRHE